MSGLRIVGIPVGAIPEHSVPVYGLPSALSSLEALRTLEIVRGGIVLGIPATVISSRNIDFTKPDTRPTPLTIGFQFTVRNPASNPDAEITDFTVDGDIVIFDAFGCITDAIGVTLAESENFRLCFMTDFDQTELLPGTNRLTGTWVLENVFDGYPGITESYSVTIVYNVIMPGSFENGKQIPIGPGRIAPHAYIDEFSVLNTREIESFQSGKPLNPGNNN